MGKFRMYNTRIYETHCKLFYGCLLADAELFIGSRDKQY